MAVRTAWSTPATTHCEKKVRNESGTPASGSDAATRAALRDATRQRIITPGTTTRRRYAMLSRGSEGVYASGVHAAR